MTRMVGDAEFQADDGRAPGASPELSAEAIGSGTSMQQLGQADELRARQPPRGAGWRSTPERRGPGGAGPCHPLTDRALADPQSLGNLALTPALLLEVPGLEPSGFFPAVWCGVHAWQSTTTLPKL
jgi:hypothetical protein